MTPRSVPVLLAALSLTFVAAACGDDDDSASTQATASTQPATESTAGATETTATETTATETPATATESTARATETTAGRSGTEAPAQGEAEIVISRFSFGDPITVPAGTTVTVRNDDSTIHTWTSDDGLWDSGPL